MRQFSASQELSLENCFATKWSCALWACSIFLGVSWCSQAMCSLLKSNKNFSQLPNVFLSLFSYFFYQSVFCSLIFTQPRKQSPSKMVTEVIAQVCSGSTFCKKCVQNTCFYMWKRKIFVTHLLLPSCFIGGSWFLIVAKCLYYNASNLTTINKISKDQYWKMGVLLLLFLIYIININSVENTMFVKYRLTKFWIIPPFRDSILKSNILQWKFKIGGLLRYVHFDKNNLLFPIVICLCVFLTLILAIREIIRNFRRKPVIFWLHHTILNFVTSSVLIFVCWLTIKISQWIILI